MSIDQKHILLIEDDGAIAQAIEKRISSLGIYNITKAFSYISALGNWEEARSAQIEFDYIILDLNIGVQGMPNKLVTEYYPFSGMAFWDEICKDNQRKTLIKKTLFYTGYELQLKAKAIEKNWKIDDIQILSKSPDSIQKLIGKIAI